MLLLDALEGLVILGVFYIGVTQVFIPIARGTVLFPLFRSEEPKLRKELGHVQQKEVEENLREKIRKTQIKLLKKEKTP